MWDFNSSRVFAKIDAFKQRCNYLIDICLGQLQFARKGRKSKMPVFGGLKGPEIVINLNQIKETFQKNL